MSFTEANTVRDGIRDFLSNSGWTWIPPSKLPRSEREVLVESHLVEALIRLNPEIAEDPSRTDEVIYKLRAILLSVRSEGLVRANEEFASWIKGEHSMPFGKNNEHVTVRLIDFENPQNNRFVVTTEYQYYDGERRRADDVLLINGIPIIIGECKTPVRPAISWFDGALDIHEDYEKEVPALFVPNLFSFATEGKTYRYGTVRAPLDKWFPWKDDGEQKEKKLEVLGSPLQKVLGIVQNMLAPEVVLDILQNYTVFATDKKNRRIKIICRHQQYEAGNMIVERVINGWPKKGLIWHFQGSGKSLLMVFAAQKLRMYPALKSPTVIIVVDRLDLDTQITGTFNSTEIPNTIAAESRDELRSLLAQDTRKIIITLIHKFGDSTGALNYRNNIIIMVDEAHRTQEGDLGQKMHDALPNAFFFGLTGTPINKRERNTFKTFGAKEDENRYMSRYSFEDSIRDEATLPLHFEPRMINYHIDQKAINEEFAKLTDQLDEDDARELSRRAGRWANFVHGRKRVEEIAADMVKHYQENVEPNDFKAMIVCYDRQACVQYKEAIDKILPVEASDIVMTLSPPYPEEWTQKLPEIKKRWNRSRDNEEKLLDNFRDSEDPLKILIVTAKLLAGFDAPILQTMYLDKVMKDHTLLQAICRTNRPYPEKFFGLIVDYIGVFDDVGKSLDFDEEIMKKVVQNIEKFKAELPPAIQKCLSYFPGVDLTLTGYEGLIAAQECLPNNEIRDQFAADFSVLSRLWEAISPDSCLREYRATYIWLTQVYESVRPPSGNGRLLWHALGAKTIEIINEHVTVESIQDDLDTLVFDAKAVQEIINLQDHTKAKEVEIKIIKRLQKHGNNPKFVKLGQKLEDLKEKYETGFFSSLEFLKRLLELAKELVEAEKQVETEEDQKKAKAALTELFEEAKTENTPIMVERIVNDIDTVVKYVRFDGWQRSHAGEREVQRALRRTMKKYQLHREQDLFDRAYDYIKQYY